MRCVHNRASLFKTGIPLSGCDKNFFTQVKGSPARESHTQILPAAVLLQIEDTTMKKPTLPALQESGPQPPWLWVIAAVLLLLILMTLLFRRGDEIMWDRTASLFHYTNSRLSVSS